MGLKMLVQALRAEGISALPNEDEAHQSLWEKLLRFTDNRNRTDLLTDLGLGKLRVIGTPRKQVGLAGFGLEVVEYVAP